MSDLTPDCLRAMGIDALLVDVDCTLKRYRADELGTAEAAWLASMHEAGIGLCLVSNGMAARISPLAARLGVAFVARALKPLPFGCWKAIRRMGFDQRHTAMVGDQLFTDVLAGRLAGLTTLLIAPIHPEDEPWFTRLKRPLERRLLARFPRSD